MSKVKDIIESIEWNMSKSDFNDVFVSMERLPPHPTQNAIGFATMIDGIPAAVICYFQRQLFKERLGAVNIMVYDDPPPQAQLKQTFAEISDELSEVYGKPKVFHDEIIVWAIRGSVIQLMINNGVIGIRYGNPRIDLPSKMAILTEGV